MSYPQPGAQQLVPMNQGLFPFCRKSWARALARTTEVPSCFCSMPLVVGTQVNIVSLSSR